jgi:NCS1 family nucleobase:cation symporter-1
MLGLTDCCLRFCCCRRWFGCVFVLQGGWNVWALVAVALGMLPCLPGLLASIGAISSAGPMFSALYDCAWFVGLGVSSLVYWGLMRLGGHTAAAGEASAPA